MTDHDERIERILQELQTIPKPKKSTIDAARGFFEAVGERFPTVPGVRVEPVDAGGRPAESVMPSNDEPVGTFLYVHGGAFVIGSPRIYRNQSSRLALASGMRVLTLDYRLAPEHPFPAGLDDCVAAYRWLLAQGEQPEQIVVAGDSAGGNLVLATMLRLRDAHDPLPAAGVLISPWVDLECGGETMVTNADSRHLAQRESLLENAAQYLAGHDPRDPLASPLHAELSDLPPLLIQVAGDETLLDDARMLAERARDAGVETTLEIWDGMIHEWHLLAALLPPDEPLPDADEALERVADFARTHLAT